MKTTQFVITTTLKYADDLMRTARKVPEEKLTWKPLDNGRSVLEIVQECAHCPLWTVGTVNQFLGIEESLTDYEDTSKWTTLDACEAALRKHLEQFQACVNAFPEDRLEETVTIQYGTFTLAESISFAMWNIDYHIGQINYIQTLYGDKEMF